MWNRLSLRVRYTLMSATLIIAVCAVLTGVLIYNAGVFSAPVDTGKPTTDTVIDLFRSEDAAAAEYQANRQEFIVQSVILTAAAAMMGIVCTWFIARRALKPISRLSGLIENIDINNLSQPLPLPASTDEVARLTKSFNGMLDKLNDAFLGQRRFVQNAAHELKTPVAAILANIQVLELDDNPSIEDYKETITAAKENAERMSALVQDLLLVNVESRPESVSVSFQELVEEILTDLAREIEEKQIEVFRAGNVTLRGNAALLKRAFHNLILNAIRYNHSGGSISIEACPEKIVISDTGIGIPSNHLDKVFEPFYCVDASRSRVLGGSGLGLAIVKQILDQHNIKVMAESPERGGTKFTLLLKS